MWFVVTLISTIIVATAFFIFKEHRKKLKLGFLTLMLFGTFIMVLVDHLIAFIESQSLIESRTDGLIPSGTILGFAMIIPIFMIWIIALSIPYIKKQIS